MNILYCGNDKIFQGIRISLRSLLRLTKEPVTVYLFTMRVEGTDGLPITAEHVRELSELGASVHCYDLTKLYERELGGAINNKTAYTPYCMLRLFADLVEKMPDRVLYLDADTVCKQDVSVLYNRKLENYEYAAARDYLGKLFFRPGYVNSGVLLLNLTKIRETGLFERARKRCREKPMPFPDQDALNHETKHVLRIPRTFNEQRKLRKDTVIRHYCKSLRFLPYPHTTNRKPWEGEEQLC